MINGNALAPASKYQFQVAGGAGLSAFTYAGNTYSSVQIRLHASGTLAYTNSDGVDVTLTEMPAGIECVEAKAILAATNVKVTVYI